MPSDYGLQRAQRNYRIDAHRSDRRHEHGEDLQDQERRKKLNGVDWLT